MKKSGFWRYAITYVLILQLVCPISGLSLRATAEESPTPILPRMAAPASETASIVDKALANPLLETVQSWGKLPAGTAPSASDPAIDDDPFFLRAQNWIPNATPVGEENAVAFAADAASVTLAPGGANRAWHLQAPLHAVYSTGQWVVLAANQTSFFDRAGGGEGLFFVSVEDLQGGAANAGRVPVYFFPLPDQGWTGAVRALEFPELERLVVVDNHGEGLPLDEEDIETVIGVGKMNLTFAMGMGARAAALTTPTTDGRRIFPPRGSTAGFGILFTGFDRDRPALSVFQPLHHSWWQRVERDLTGWLIPHAHAEDVAEDEDALMHNFLWAGAVTGTMLIASAVLKYTVYRDFFKARHEGEAPRSTLGVVGREGRDIGDVFAHTLSLARGLPKVWFGKGVQYFVDSWFPRLNSAHNKLITRFLDWSVYYSMEAAQRVPVNLRTVALQFFVLGGVDTVSYAAQLYWVTPWVARQLADAYPGLKDRVMSEFADGNAAIQGFRRNELVDNLVGHLTDPSVAIDLKDYYTATLLPVVEDALNGRGIKPGDPTYEDEKKALLKQKVEEKLATYGLPGKKDFLFDAATLWNFVTEKMLGYGPGQLKAEMKRQTFVGQDRPGLLAPAVRAALSQARARLAQHPGDPALVSAVQMLEKASGLTSYVKNFALYPYKVLHEGLAGRGPPALREVASSVRSLRQILVALTYEGPVEPALKLVPSPWVQAVGEPGARLAGELFRRSFFGYATNRPELLKAPSATDRSLVEARAPSLDRQAQDELAANHAAEIDALVTAGAKEADARQQMATRYPGELEFLRDKGVTRAVSDKVDADTPYTRPHHDWYRRRQEARAKARAVDSYARRFGHPFDAATAAPADRAAWNEVYANEMMSEVSLYPDYEAAPGLKEKVETRAQAELQLNLQAPKVKAFLDGLSAEERVDFAATMYAENVTRAYVDLTVNSDLPATSTAQPGRFQWVRQTHFVREHPFLTRALRTVEAFFPVESHEAGLSAKLYRNLPGLYDFMIGNSRSYRNLLTASLAVYPFTKLLWGLALPPHLFLLAAVTIPLSTTPIAILNRFFQMQGFKPLASIRNMFFYSAARSWVGFGDLVPDMVLERDFKNLAGAVESKFGEVRAEAARLASGGSTCPLSFSKLGR